MTPSNPCIITGCAMVIDGCWAWGDLFQYGDCYVFNANTCTADHPGQEEIRGETKWSAGIVPTDIKQVICTDRQCRPFERRGVIVAPIQSFFLNKAALEYLVP